MIDEIDRRLQNWAEYQLRGNIVGGGPQCALAMIGSGGRSTAGEIHWPDEVLDTDRAVAGLADDLRRVIDLHYLRSDLSPEQRASKCRLSRKTFYRRLDTAHQHVLFLLSPRRVMARRAERVTLRREQGVSVKICQR